MPVFSLDQGEFRSFIRGEHGFDQYVQVEVGSALLHVDAQPAFGSECDESVIPAVADVEIDAGGKPLHEGERLAMPGCPKGELLIAAAELIAQQRTESGTTQSEAAP